MSYSSEVLADSPVLYWRLGDSSGSTAADALGLGRTGTYVATPTLGTTGALTGDADTAVTLNGATQWVIAPTSGTADTALKAISAAFSLEVWIKPSSVSANRGILDRYGNGAAGASTFAFYMSSGTVRFVVKNTSDVDATLSSAAPLSTGSWVYLVATYDGTTSRLYVNGTLNNSLTTNMISGAHARSSQFYAGYIPVLTSAFVGDMDEVAVYGTALSSTRISAHYAAGTGTSPLTGSGSLTLSASGSAGAAATGSGSISLSGSGAAKAAATGAGSLTLSAVGDVVPPSTATGSGSLSLSGAGAAGIGASGSGAISLTGSGAAVGSSSATGAGFLSLSGSGSATLADSGTGFLSLSAFGVAEVLYVTDTSNLLNGRNRRAVATSTVTHPAAVTPPRAAVKYDKSVPYPPPTLVNGRPT